MPRFKRQSRSDNKRKTVSDDYIYNDPDTDGSAETSDTPEEAIRKLRGTSVPRQKYRIPLPGDSFAPADETAEKAEPEIPEHEEPDAGNPVTEEPPPSAEKRRKVYSSGIELDDNLQPVESASSRREGRRHPVLRGALMTLVTVLLLGTILLYILHRLAPEIHGLDAPENAISDVMTPVQTFFSGITESVAGYFRTLKLRANIEREYNALRAENEQLVYKAMLADELQQTLSQYEDLHDEITANAQMEPIVCTVIGRSDSNYFSTFTINKGLSDGVEDYMAVTISGALVGYTENVQSHSATVRTVIDSEASIAAIIQSSRDQGTVRGTLGIDGTPLCRMYYLPDDNLPRPGDLVVTSGVGMSFPKGIPIGVVRESTRGMEANKQYIVLEPNTDFQHLEYVIVLRYKPLPEAVEGRENGRTNVEFVPVVSARPSPVVPQIASSLFDSQSTEDPTLTETPMPEATETPTPSPTPTPTPSPTPDFTPLEYQVFNPRGEPTPTATPTAEPTPTPYYTPDPDDLIIEED